jgi:hypothetical protein
MHPHQKVDFSMAMNSAPFEGLGMGVELDYRVLPHWSVLGRARLGSSGGEAQSGGALGISYSARPPRPPYQNPKHAKDTHWRSPMDPKPPKEVAPVAPDTTSRDPR